MRVSMVAGLDAGLTPSPSVVPGMLIVAPLCWTHSDEATDARPCGAGRAPEPGHVCGGRREDAWLSRKMSPDVPDRGDASDRDQRR